MASMFVRFKLTKWDYQTRYDILQTRPEETPKQACLETFEVVGQLDRYNTLVTGLLRVALGTKLHSVHEYSMEFYSSLSFKAKAKPFDEEGGQLGGGGGGGGAFGFHRKVWDESGSIHRRRVR
ncbi:hypothetical protein Hanom_Chr17g01583171 [Helianthus anomalus]